jgi:hypothetical protein
VLARVNLGDETPKVQRTFHTQMFVQTKIAIQRDYDVARKLTGHNSRTNLPLKPAT